MEAEGGLDSCMRILLAPLIGIANVQTDSNYIFFADLVRKANEKGGFYFYMVLPKKANNLEELPNCEYILVDQSADFFEESMRANSEVVELFNRRGGTKLFDLLFTAKTGGSLVYQSVLSDYRRTEAVPTILMEAMVRAWKKPNDADAALRALSYSTAYTWLLSDEEKERALRLIRVTCSPAMVNQFLERVHISPHGIRVKNLDHLLDKPKYEKFSLFFGARFSREKRPDIVVDFLEHFFSYGRDVDIHVTTQHVGSRYLLKYGNKASSIKELVKGCPRSEFLERASRSHVFICASDDESWPGGFWEQLYIIRVGIFPDHAWVRAVLPKDYPYIYKSKTEGHAMLRWIYENYDEAVNKVAWIRDWIREHGDMDRMLDKVIDWMATIPMNDHNVSGNLTQLFIETAEKMGNKFYFTPFLEQVQKDAMTFKPISVIARTKYPNKYEVYRTLLKLGYKDLYNSSDPYLIKE